MLRTIATRVALVTAVGLLLSSCDDDSEPTPTPSPTTSTTSTPPPDVGTTGPANSHITWELERGVSADDPWVEALQRYVAYDTYITSLPENRRDGDDAKTLASAYDRFATGEEFAGVVESTTGSLRGDVRTGPLWIRLSAGRTSGTTATLVACSDQRYHTFAKESAAPKRPPFASLYTLRKTGGVWKVSRQRTAPKADLARCRTWDVSRHRP